MKRMPASGDMLLAVLGLGAACVGYFAVRWPEMFPLILLGLGALLVVFVVACIAWFIRQDGSVPPEKSSTENWNAKVTDYIECAHKSDALASRQDVSKAVRAEARWRADYWRRMAERAAKHQSLVYEAQGTLEKK